MIATPPPTFEDVVGAAVDPQVLANRCRATLDDDCLEAETLDELETTISRVVKTLEAIGETRSRRKKSEILREWSEP